MKTIIEILKFNVLFDVDGKRFILYTNAVDWYITNRTDKNEMNALNIFTGWHRIGLKL